MTTTAQNRKSRKPERRIRMVYPISDKSAGIIEIAVDKQEDLYAIRPMPSDFGKAYHLVKGELVEDTEAQTLHLRSAAEYDVLLNGRESSCTCPGHTYRGKCKHVDGLSKLHQLGKL